MQTVQILVIEDNAPDVLLISESLHEQSLAHEITHYLDGEEALARLTSSEGKRSDYDLVILDLNMPRVGGLQILASLRNTPEFEGVPFLVLTSSIAPEDRGEAKRLGADRYLRKPSDLYEFLRNVGETVREMVAKPDCA